MQDRKVAIRSVVAVAMWLVGVGLVVVNLFVDPPVGVVGLMVVGGAMVLNIRGYFCRFHEQMRNAFELGRDYERGRAEVRSLR